MVVKEQERNCSLLEGGITEAHGKGYRYREKWRIEDSNTVSHRGDGSDCGIGVIVETRQRYLENKHTLTRLFF